MSARVLSHLAVAAFVLLGTLCIGLRYWSRYEDEVARKDSQWRLSYDITFQVEDAIPAKITRVAIPSDTPYCTVLNEEFVYRDLVEHKETGPQTGTRESVLEIPYDGTHEYTADFELRLRPQGTWLDEAPLERLGPNSRARFTKLDDRVRAEAQTVLTGLTGSSSSEAARVQAIFNYCSRDIRLATKESGTDDPVQAMSYKVATPLGRARAMVALCRAGKIPARLVTGFELRQEEQATPRVWVEVFQGHSWIPFDPEYGYARYIPSDFLPIRRDGDQIVRADDGVQSEPKYEIRRLGPPDEVLTRDVRHPAQIFDLTRLQLDMHQVITLMLLLPLGALITAVFRNVVGIQSFGTFAPALLAMSFIYADWGSGLVTLSVVVAAGLVGRRFMERLHLLMVPRLSIILTTIILFVTFGVSLLEYVGLTQSPDAVLLPLVILTIMIERFYVTTEEDGTMYALQLAAGTIVVATFCYLLLRWDEVGRVMLVYPEIHFYTIAAFILLGRYAGYRLTELWRFRDLVK